MNASSEQRYGGQLHNLYCLYDGKVVTKDVVAVSDRRLRIREDAVPLKMRTRIMITADGSCVFRYDPAIKAGSSQWNCAISQVCKNSSIVNRANKHND